MKTPLIYDDLTVFDWQRDSFSKNVVGVDGPIIARYPQLSPSEVHDVSALQFFIQSDDMTIYKFNGTILKYIIRDALDDAEIFYREIVVGLNINRLNLNNFVHTIGYHVSDKCSIPNLRTNKGCIYLYVKEVDGPTLTKFIPTASLVQFKDIMIKLLDAYKIAHDELDFCHYDLHSSNVIISSKDGELIPVIIDFGSSHIKLEDGRNIGEYWPEEGRYDGVALWVYDLFKIFAFSWRDSLYEIQYRRIQAEFDERKRAYDNVIDNICEYTKPCISYGFQWNEELDDYEPLKETVAEFIQRLESSNVQLLLGLTLEYLRDEMSTEIAKRDAKLKILRENSANLEDINKYCRKVLKYFNSEIWGTSYLEHYSKSVSPTFGSSVTEAGRDAVLDDFITYVRTL